MFMAERRKGSEKARLLKIEQQRKAERHSLGLGKSTGRPVDPQSIRQQLLAARGQRKQVCARRQAEAAHARSKARQE